jgi:hypothetical protein
MRLAYAIAIAFALGSACRVAPPAPERAALPQDSLLVEVSAAERARVATARVAHGRARDDHAAAQRSQLQANEGLAAAERERNAARDKVEWANAGLGRSEASGTTTEVGTATQAVSNAEAARGVQDARCELADRVVIEAEQQVAVCAAQVAVAAAQLELAKAIAINTLDRPEVQKPEIAVFESAVRRAEGKANVARAGLAAAAREVEIGRSEVGERERGR